MFIQGRYKYWASAHALMIRLGRYKSHRYHSSSLSQPQQIPSSLLRPHRLRESIVICRLTTWIHLRRRVTIHDLMLYNGSKIVELSSHELALVRFLFVTLRDYQTIALDSMRADLVATIDDRLGNQTQVSLRSTLSRSSDIVSTDMAPSSQPTLSIPTRDLVGPSSSEEDRRLIVSEKTKKPDRADQGRR